MVTAHYDSVGAGPEAMDDAMGMAVILEARGTSGQSLLFETSPGNRRLLQHYARVVGHPAGNSVLYTLYRTLSNDTDFTVYKDAGVLGYNLANATLALAAMWRLRNLTAGRAVLGFFTWLAARRESGTGSWAGGEELLALIPNNYALLQDGPFSFITREYQFPAP